MAAVTAAATILNHCHFASFPIRMFHAPPSDEEIVTFIKELGHKSNIKSVTDVVVDQMHQPWRTFTSIINKCLSRKITGLDKIRLSSAQILWGTYYNKNVDFVELLLEDFVFQIDNKDHKKQEKMYYPRFTKVIIHHFISKDKSISMRNIIFMHTVCDDSVLGTLRFVSKSDEYQVYGALLPERMSNQQLRDSPAYKTYLSFATGAATPKKAKKFKKLAYPSKKKTLVAIEEPAEKPAKKPATRRQYAGGADLESEVPDEPKGKSIDTSEGTGLKPGVLDVSKADSSKSEYESWGDSDDDNNDDDQQSDDERTESDNDDKAADINKTNDEEEDEFVHTPDDYVPTNDENIDDEEYDHINEEMYSDVNVEMKDTELEGEGKDDEEMTNAGYVDAECENVNQVVSSDQVKDVVRAIILNFDNIPSGDTEIISMMDVKVQHEDPSIQTSPLLTLPVTNEVKTLRNINHGSAIRAAVKSKVPIVVKEYLGTSLDDALHKHKALYHALIESILEDEDATDKGVADNLKKIKSDNANRDEGPPARPDQGLKMKKTSKETEPSKKAKSTRASKCTTKSQPKSTGKFAQAKETVFEAGDTQVPHDLREDTGNTDELPVVNVDPKDWFKKLERPPTPDPEWNEGKSVKNKPTQKWICDLAKAKKPSKTFDDLMSTPIYFSAFVMNYLSYVELDYNMEECYKALTDQLDWNNPEGGSTGRTYTTYLTKTNAAKYDMKGIEDMVLYTGDPTDKDSTGMLPKGCPNIISDQKLYKFKEGNFPRLHLNDIEDMLLLVVQNRLFNLEHNVIVHFTAALCMFTRRIVIQKRVEDLQLGVESYQKKLNISKPRTREEDLSRISPYTTLLNPQGVIYEHKLNRKRLMRSDELYKFNDGTLQSVRDTIHDMAANLRMGYNKAMSNRIWTHLDKTRSHIIVKEIDHQLRERRLMRSLEKFVGGRHYGEDLRLLRRTI
ncbi:hypothetical protein Tco_0211963 [Tanacetum coccineum]